MCVCVCARVRACVSHRKGRVVEVQEVWEVGFCCRFHNGIQVHPQELLTWLESRPPVSRPAVLHPSFPAPSASPVTPVIYLPLGFLTIREKQVKMQKQVKTLTVFSSMLLYVHGDHEDY